MRHIERPPLAGVLLCRSVFQALKRGTLGGVLLCSSVGQAFDGPAFLLFSCWHVLGRGVRGEAMEIAPSPMHDSAASPCFHGCPAFLHRNFPPQSPPSHPLNSSLRCQQQPLPWDCSIISFFFFLFFQFYFIFKLYIIVLVLPNISLNYSSQPLCCLGYI